MIFKIKVRNSMTKVNPKNANETKSDIFQWDIFIGCKILKHYFL